MFLDEVCLGRITSGGVSDAVPGKSHAEMVEPPTAIAIADSILPGNDASIIRTPPGHCWDGMISNSPTPLRLKRIPRRIRTPPQPRRREEQRAEDRERNLCAASHELPSMRATLWTSIRRRAEIVSTLTTQTGAESF